MIIKIRPNGSNFHGAMRYLLDKPRSHDPHVIDTNMAGRSADAFADQMHAIAERDSRHRAGPVWHAIVSWHADDHVSPEQMTQVVHGMFAKLDVNLATNQYVIVQHRDEDFPHAHVIVNRVGLDGSLFVGEWSARKVEEYREQCEQEGGWTVARGRSSTPSRQQAEIHFEQRMGITTAKHQVHQAVQAAIDHSNGTFAGFVESCRQGGRIVPDLSFNDTGFNGASFALMSVLRPNEPEVNAQGEPYVFKGSQIAWGKRQLEEGLYQRREDLVRANGGDAIPAYREVAAQAQPRSRSRSPSRPRKHFTFRPDRKGVPVFRFKAPWTQLSTTATMFDAIFHQQITAANAHRLRMRPDRGRSR